MESNHRLIIRLENPLTLLNAFTAPKDCIHLIWPQLSSLNPATNTTLLIPIIPHHFNIFNWFLQYARTYHHWDYSVSTVHCYFKKHYSNAKLHTRNSVVFCKIDVRVFSTEQSHRKYILILVLFSSSLLCHSVSFLCSARLLLMMGEEHCVLWHSLALSLSLPL